MNVVIFDIRLVEKSLLSYVAFKFLPHSHAKIYQKDQLNKKLLLME